MTTMFKITWRYLKRQKRNTIMAIVMVMLAVGLITAITSILNCLNAVMAESIKSSEGSQHVTFNAESYEQARQLANNAYFEDSVISCSLYNGPMSPYTSEEFKLIEIAPFTEKSDYYEWHIFTQSFDPDDKLTIYDLEFTEKENLSLGHYPMNAGEIVIPAASYVNLGSPPIGSQITITLQNCRYNEKSYEEGVDTSMPYGLYDVISEKPMTYTLAGVGNGEYSGIILNSGDEFWLNEKDNINYTVYGRFYPSDVDLDGLMYNEILAGTGIQLYYLNKDVLNAEGIGVQAKALMVVDFATYAFFGLIILACCRLVIDCAFEISSQERIRQYGLLMSVGASTSELIGIFFWESLIIGGIGSVLGAGLGVGLYRIIFNIAGNIDGLDSFLKASDITQMLRFVISPPLIIFSIIAGILWVFLSSYGTGMRIIRKTPAEAISGKVSKSFGDKIPKAGFIMKRLGIGAQIASINAKRNKKRYIITIISVSMSLILFAGFSYVIDLMEKDAEMVNNSLTYYDFYVQFKGNNREKELTEELSGLPYVINAQAEYTSAVVEQLDKETYGKQITLMAVNRQTYETLLDTPMSYDELNKSGGFLASYNSYLPNQFDTDPKEWAESLSLPNKISYRSLLGTYNENGETVYSTSSLDIVGVCSTKVSDYSDKFAIICTEETAETAAYSELFDLGKSVYGASDTATAMSIKVEKDGVHEMEELLNNRQDITFIMNLQELKAPFDVALKLTKLCGYLIISLIGAIAAINLINIIVTSILNRRSEIGLLKATGMSECQLMASTLLDSCNYVVKAAVATAAVLTAILFFTWLVFQSEPMSDFTGIDPDYSLLYIKTLEGMAIALVVTALASIYPLNLIKKTSVIDTIRYQD